MRTLGAFLNVSVDGCYAGPGGDLGWAHARPKDAEFEAFVADNAKGGGQLLFGRVTYQMMAAWWPTPQAAQSMPVVAERMNSCAKVVFSRTLAQAAWNNTALVAGDLVESVRALKGAAGPGMTILGSGSIVAQLAQAGLIDEFQFVVVPVALGGGQRLFAGIAGRVDLRLTRTRAFANGSVLHCYAPRG